MNRLALLTCCALMACGPNPPMMTEPDAGSATGFDYKVSNLPDGTRLEDGPDVEINESCLWNGETGYFCGLNVPWVVVDQNDTWTPKLAVFSVGSLRIGQNGSVTLLGAYPIVVVSRDDIIVVGSIQARSPGNGVGGVAGGGRAFDGVRGAGPGGGEPGDETMHFGSSGGGHCGAGGGSGARLVGGKSNDVPYLSPLRGGSAGGSRAGQGGHGGGALQLSAAGKLQLAESSLVYLGGGAGIAPGGGGGSGGALLLEAEAVTIAGHIVLHGGSGAASCASGIDIGNGQPALLDGAQAQGGVNANHARGGNGSALLYGEGFAGDTESVFCAGQPAIGGGGGGASGVLSVHTRTQKVTYEATGKAFVSSQCSHEQPLPPL